MSRCMAVKQNTRADNFDCRLPDNPPHPVHVDSRTGVRWGHPGRKTKGGLPYGIRKLHEKNSGHSTKTKPGVKWSAAPARS